MGPAFRRLAPFLFPLLLAQCAVISAFEPPRAAVLREAAERGWQVSLIDTGKFVIATYGRLPAGTARRLAVYIEGDGFAWVNRYRASSDPTPKDPISLKLALADPGAAVVYVARPCQYTKGEQRKGCHPLYWTTRRLSEEVIGALGRVIDRLKERHGARRLHLIGYSGGGAAAALLAARRSDVDLLVTVVANLDTGMWTEHHDVTPLIGSLNPVNYVGALRAVPQVHLAGEDDDEVPAKIVRSFTDALDHAADAELRVIPDFDHRCCWSEGWGKTIAAIRAARDKTR